MRRLYASISRTLSTKIFKGTISIIDFVFLTCAFVSFLSVPLFGLKAIIPWCCIGVLFCVVVIGIIFVKGFRIDRFSIWIVAYALIMLFSTLLNLRKSRSFAFTPYLMSVLIFGFYDYLREDQKLTKRFLFVIWLATLAFAIIFVIRYRTEIISLSIGRLGDDFGDQNEQSLYFSFALVYSAFMCLYSKKAFVSIVFAVFAILFAFCGFCNGSKAFVGSSFISIIALLVVRFGRKQWYITAAVLLILFSVFILVLYLPAFVTMRTRFLDLLSFFVGGSSYDASTGTRLFKIRDSILLFLRSPIFGFGFDGYNVHAPYGYGWTENNYFEVLTSIGIVGFASYFAPFYLSVKSFIDKKGNGDSYMSLIFTYCIFLFIWMASLPLLTIKFFDFLAPAIFSYCGSCNSQTACSTKRLRGKDNRVQKKPSNWYIIDS